MTCGIELVDGAVIRHLRDLYRHEMNCQIVLDSWHSRGWSDSYRLSVDGQVVGYGLVGGVRADPKDTITEFYVLPTHRTAASELFRRLIQTSRANCIEVQTNDRLLSLLFFDVAFDVASPTILFCDGDSTRHQLDGAQFRRAADGDRAAIGAAGLDPSAGWLIELGGSIVAAGGVLLHYNIPYGDIFMAVAEPNRKRGIGRFLVQELKRECYAMGRVPAARCGASNLASRATLQSAGMSPCARVLTGLITR